MDSVAKLLMPSVNTLVRQAKREKGRQHHQEQQVSGLTMGTCERATATAAGLRVNMGTCERAAAAVAAGVRVNMRMGAGIGYF